MLSLQDRVNFVELRIKDEIDKLPSEPTETEADESFQWIQSQFEDEEFDCEKGKKIVRDLADILDDIDQYPNIINAYFAMLDYIDNIKWED